MVTHSQALGGLGSLDWGAGDWGPNPQTPCLLPTGLSLSVCSKRAGQSFGPGSSAKHPHDPCPRALQRLLGALGTAYSPWSGPASVCTWISGAPAAPSEAQPRARRGLQGRVRRRALVKARCIRAQAGKVPLGPFTTPFPRESSQPGREALANCSTYGPRSPSCSVRLLETGGPG